MDHEQARERPLPKIERLKRCLGSRRTTTHDWTIAMTVTSDSRRPKVCPIDLTRICRPFVSFHLIGDLCFVNKRCVGFTSIFLGKEDLLFKLTRGDVKSIFKKLNKRVECTVCRCCQGSTLPVTIFSKNGVTISLGAGEICNFKRYLEEWTTSKPVIQYS